MVQDEMVYFTPATSIRFSKQKFTALCCGLLVLVFSFDKTFDNKQKDRIFTQHCRSTISTAAKQRLRLTPYFVWRKITFEHSGIAMHTRRRNPEHAKKYSHLRTPTVCTLEDILNCCKALQASSAAGFTSGQDIFWMIQNQSVKC